jgi:hypothetical protein
LSLDHNQNSLKNTINSIKKYAWDRQSICLTDDSASDEELQSLNKLCSSYRAGNTITSLINLGFEELKNDWIFILFSGSLIQRYLEKKLQLFAKEENEILFPVIDNR